jgi:hypothetical protein
LLKKSNNYQSCRFLGCRVLSCSFKLDHLEFCQKVVLEVDLQISGLFFVPAQSASHLGLATSMLESDLQCGSFHVGGLDGGRVGRDFAGLSVGEEGEAALVRVQLQV